MTLWHCSYARNGWRPDIRVILVVLLLKYTELVYRLFNLWRRAMAYQYNLHVCVGLVQFFYLYIFTRLSIKNPWYSTDWSLLFYIANWLFVLNPVGSLRGKRLKITAQILFYRYVRLSCLDRVDRRAVHVASYSPAAVDNSKTSFNGRGSLNNA